MLETRPVQVGETFVAATTFNESCSRCPANSGTEVVNGERRILRCALQAALLECHVTEARNIFDRVKAVLGEQIQCLPSLGGRNARQVARMLDRLDLIDEEAELDR